MVKGKQENGKGGKEWLKEQENGKGGKEWLKGNRRTAKEGRSG